MKSVAEVLFRSTPGALYGVVKLRSGSLQTFRLIAVVGGSGLGKTWLAAELAGWFGEAAAHLCLDHLYRDFGHLPETGRERVNFDDPAAIDWDSLRTVIESLERGETANTVSLRIFNRR